MSLTLPKDLKQLKVGAMVKVRWPEAEAIFVIHTIEFNCLKYQHGHKQIIAWFNEMHPLSVEVIQ